MTCSGDPRLMPSCSRPPEIKSAAPASSAMYIGFSYRMSITAVPISIREVRAPTAASSGNGDAQLPGEVVHPEVGAVRAQLLGGHRQLDGLQQRVRGRPGPRVRSVGPVAEGEETDVLHDLDNLAGV